jgi:hypothetical protein
MTTETKRITKDDWWVICRALDEYAGQLADMARDDKWADSMRDSFASDNEKARELLTRLVNTKLAERDKWIGFQDYIEL